ncbi:hypothetical protein BJ138DRAFT_235053 [Hygrophoropsis aurantiaca]|uniref:Uncharacterized protein n=1 Tax=Hygrophoropsis aurantiaca TaxID=72124 RepID=A0ACB8A818_9AGAM|nr:hypothetical protein BJ138DRAFT_235053 [Hygrophoropsis aurantiaca]
MSKFFPARLVFLLTLTLHDEPDTDVQEYLGSYASDLMTGKLVFKDGFASRALNHASELNLAPADVLGALDCLLDVNRELTVPKMQEAIHPHPHFMPFVTGHYTGRKFLTRELRKRFLEAHLQDVPQTDPLLDLLNWL